MRIQRTSQVITTAVIFLTLLTFVCGFLSRHMRQQETQAYDVLRESLRMADQLAAGSDRLTAAVRGYAATGDQRYADDFNRELDVTRSRDRAMARLQQLGLTQGELESLTQAKHNSDQLVTLENQAFAAAKANDLSAAIAAVFGHDYQTAKDSIMQPIAEARRALELRLADDAARLSVWARWLANIALTTTALNALAILGALLGFYRHRVVNPLAVLNSDLRDLLAHKDGVSIDFQDEDSEIGEIARSLESYRRDADEVATQRWVKGQVAEIAGLLQTAESPREFGERLLSKLVPLIEAGCGALYLRDEAGDRFRFAAGYGYQVTGETVRSFGAGEGLVGQCAVERKVITLGHVPPDYVSITSGVGSAVPLALAVVPIISRERVLAVLEIASFQALTGTQQSLLTEIASLAALNLEILERNLKTRELLDQTQRQTSELQTQHEFQKALLDSIPYPMFVKDAETRFVDCNRAYERTFGVTRDELQGKTVLDLDYIPLEAREKFHAEDAAVIRDANRKSYELPIAFADGALHTTLYSVDGFRIGQDQPGGLIGLLVDITERKREQEELSIAKMKAEEATEMKSMFLANMSHEIRTPMNAIIGLAHLALKTELTAKQRDYISKVHNAGTSLLSIINDILDFSKIEAGKLDIEDTDFTLDDVISSVTTLTGQKAHEKGLEFLADVPSTVPQYLIGDPLRLGQILTNLVNNAVKFTETGEIRLRAELVERTGEKVQLRFSVRDTGVGMTPEQSNRLFQPFIQADMSTTRKHGGTGLGLTISRRLVEMMGGRIWIESEAGVGSTFFFTVWLGVGLATGRGKIFPEELRTLKVLVVDDNPAAREILIDALQGVASQVDAVGSGAECVSAVRQHEGDSPYDVVFMDWRMPGMDGLEATRQIKNDPLLKKQPNVVLVTAFGREEVREEAEKLHIDAFLVKPVTKSMLVDTLVTVFAPNAGARTAATASSESQMERLRGARILLAEDNEINQQIAVELLEGVGAVVEVVDNGRQAVEKLMELAVPDYYDVFLTDLQMPEMDGYQATTRVRAESRFAKLPIIAMTAHATIEERQRCLEAGMNDHVAKPIDPEALFETIARYYRSRSAPTPSSPPTPEVTPVATPDDLPSVPGLDPADGVRRVAGNRKLYLKLLRQFTEQQADAPAKIAAQLEVEDFPSAERAAHTVKGIAANLAASGVQAAAGNLENAIRERLGRDQIEPLRKAFAEVLTDFLTRLRLALGGPAPAAPESAPPASDSPVDPAQLKAVVTEMLKQLSQFDTGATDNLAAHRALLTTVFAPAEWKEFEQEVQGYAFAEAQARLEKLAGDKGLK